MYVCVLGCCWVGRVLSPKPKSLKVLFRGLSGQRTSPVCVEETDRDPVNRAGWGISVISEDRRYQLPSPAHVQASPEAQHIHLMT